MPTCTRASARARAPASTACHVIRDVNFTDALRNGFERQRDSFAMQKKRERERERGGEEERGSIRIYRAVRVSAKLITAYPMESHGFHLSRLSCSAMFDIDDEQCRGILSADA